MGLIRYVEDNYGIYEVVLKQNPNFNFSKLGFQIEKVYRLRYIAENGDISEAYLDASNIECLVSNWCYAVNRYEITKKDQDIKNALDDLFQLREENEKLKEKLLKIKENEPNS